MLPPDDHVHSQWSYDTGDQASMAAACEQAIAAGVPAVAFTEHLDFTGWGSGDGPADAPPPADARGGADSLDVDGYLACLAECRDRYPSLRIRSGVEAGEAHLFAGSLGAFLRATPVDRILGSLHSVVYEGRLVTVDTLFGTVPAADVMRRYLAEVVRLVDSPVAFEVLAHLNFARRYWPPRQRRYVDTAFEEEHRAVLRALARSGRVLEVNTKTGPASLTLLRWWRDAGGAAVCFGSDAHVPWLVGDQFKLAVDVVEAAGFRPGRDPFDFWRR